MSVQITISGVSREIEGRPLFADLSLGIGDNERLGLVGPNGSGKSSLLRVLAGTDEPDRGSVHPRRGLTLRVMPQEDDFGDARTCNEAVLAAIAPGDDSEVRAGIALGRCGLDPSAGPGTLSGGWKRRLSLARVLADEPDIAILDEPTNHLDLEGLAWLESLLKKASFGWITVSHDRAFLENTCTRILEINPRFPGGHFLFDGRYSDFLLKRDDHLAGQKATEASLRSKVRREKEWLARGPKARSTKAKHRIESAGRLIDALAEVAERNRDPGFRLELSGRRKKPRDLLKAAALRASIGERTLVSRLDWTLTPGQRIGLVGHNGCGKSTLLKVLAGEREPDSGTLKKAESCDIVHFDQERSALDGDKTLERVLCPSGETVWWHDRPIHVATWGRRFLFPPRRLKIPVGKLSGGERARALMARLMLEPADLLLLDEPTNDLDIPSREILEECLLDFEGALVLVTHDRTMLERISTELWGFLPAGRLERVNSVEDWENRFREAQATPAAGTPAAEPRPRSKPRLTYFEKKELETIGAEIEKAEAEVELLTGHLNDPEVLADPDRVAELGRRCAEAQQRARSLWERWEELDSR